MTGPSHKPVRVLMLLENDRYPQDGRVRQEAESLVQAGHSVSVIAPRGRGQQPRESIAGVRVFRFPAPREAAGFLGYLWEYLYSVIVMFAISLRVWVRDGFDVVHAHNPPDVLVCIAAFYKLFGKSFVFDQHDLSPEMYRVRFADGGSRIVHAALVMFERLSCRLADHVIATNESYKAMAMERVGVPAERISIVRNGPELDLFTDAEPLSFPNFGEDRAVLCYVGTIGVQDGLDYLMKALQHLVHGLGRRDVLCVVVGSGDAWRSIKNLAAELDIADFVHFTGQVPFRDVPHYVAAADICLDPDPSNEFNDRSTMIKMMEYMAMRKPIVAFELPEHRRTADAAALYAPPNDVVQFALHIQELMDDPQRRASMGKAGRNRIENQLAWIHQEKYLLAAYDRLPANRYIKEREPGLRPVEPSRGVESPGAAQRY